MADFKYSQLLVFISLLLVSGLFSHLLSDAYSLDGGRNQIALAAKLLLVGAYFFAALVVFNFRHQIKTKTTTMFWLWVALLLWSLISVLIGQFNSHTLIRLAGFWGCSLVGFALFLAMDNIKQVLKCFLWLAVAVVTVNITVLGPSGMMDWSTHNVKGAFYQKNLLGHVCFLSILVAAYNFVIHKDIYRLVSILVFVSASWLLLLSDSMTSNLLVVIAFISAFAVMVIRRYTWGSTAVIALTIASGLLLSFYWTELFSLIGKTTTFTGRTTIWTEYGELIEQRLLFGHGYGAYPEQLTGWLRLGPHSGYVELTYYLGMVGIFLFSMILIYLLKSFWQIIRLQSYLIELTFAACFLTSFLALNITETYLLNRSGLFWPLFIYLSLQLVWLAESQPFEGNSAESD